MSTSAIEAGKAIVKVGLQNSIDRDARVVQQSLRAMAANVRSIGAPLAAVGGTISASIGGALAALVFPVKIAADLERTQAAFTTLLKSGTKTKVLMSDLTKFAAETPFEFPELADSAKKLLAFGSSADSVVGELRTIGDIASGVGVPLNELAEIYGKAKVQGRLFAEDVNQLTGRGIPVIQQFAKQFGVADSEVRKLVEQGKIGFPQLQQAFASMTTGMGQFAGGMERASKTADGLWSTFKDGVTAAIRPIGQALLPTIKEYLVSLTGVTGKAQKWIESNAQLIPSIAKLAAGVAGVGLVLGATGASIIAFGSVLDSARVVREGFSTGLKITNTLLSVLSGQHAAAAAAAKAEAAAQVALGAATAKTTTSVGTLATVTKAGVASTAVMNVTLTKSVVVLGTYSGVLATTTAALTAYATAAAAAAAVSVPLVDLGLGGTGKKARRKRGPRKPRDKEVETGFGGQSLIIPGKRDGLTVGTQKRSVERQTPPRPAGFLPGGGIVGGARPEEIITVAGVVAAETGVMAAAWAGLSSIVTSAGTAIISVLSGVAAAFNAPVIVVAGLVAAIGAAVVYVASRAGIISKAWYNVSRIFTNVYDSAKQSVVGIYNAIAGGRIDLAGKIAFTAFKLVVVAGLDEALSFVWNFTGTALNAIVDFGVALRDTLWDIFTQIPRLLKAALTGAESIGDIIGDAMAGRLGSRDSLLGRTRTELQKELDQLTADAAKLNQPKAEPGKRSDTKTNAAAQLTATTSPSTATSEKSAEAERESAAQTRMKQLREEIEVMKRGQDAAELLQLARDGATQAEIAAVAELQRNRLKVSQEQARRQKIEDDAAEKRKELDDAGKAMTESMKTEAEKAQDEVNRIAELQAAGAISQETAARALSKVMTDATASMNFAPAGFTQSGSSEEAAKIAEARKALVQRAIDARASQLAAQNAANRNRVEQAKRPQTQEEKDAAERKKLEREQLDALRTIAANSKPNVVVSMR